MTRGSRGSAAGTISSSFRIQSILSPVDPSDANGTSAAGTGFSKSTASASPTTATTKRRFEAAFVVNQADPLGRPPSVPSTASLSLSAGGDIDAGSVDAGHGSAGSAAPDTPEHGGAAEYDHAMLPVEATTTMDSADVKKGIKRAPMRSSIACFRCRKSKIKCDNDHGKSPCDTCIKTGKECVYPEATTPIPLKRAEPPVIIKSEHGGYERKRVKRLEDVARFEDQSEGARYAEEVLSASYLSESVWNQLFEIYRLHFSTELPFLHLASLKERMGSRFRARQTDAVSAEATEQTNLVLLGILTLTARFHSDIVAYVLGSQAAAQAKSRGPQTKTDAAPSSASASEHFADALTKALGPLGVGMTVASVERVQAFLMLGLYEWSQVRPSKGGIGAWMYVGVAIRMAQALGLGFGDKPNARGDLKSRSPPTSSAAPRLSSAEEVVAREIRRRTMFSCFILDRMLACGKQRVTTIRTDDLQIQLPCSDMSFDLSEEVKTGFLQQSPAERLIYPAAKESLLGHFLRLVDIWGDISKYVFAGGRFAEELPPWEERSTFAQLRKRLEDLYAELPDVLRWSTSNYHRHENHQASTVFVSLHILGSLCQIMLHREYIPFIPVRCEGPVGPLDPPTFPDPNNVYGVWWKASAENVFSAAKDIVAVIDVCREKLPMSALAMFAIYTASFVGIYAYRFPHMDTERHMQPPEDAGESGESGSPVVDMRPASITGHALERMSKWLRLTNTYLTYLRDLDKTFEQIKADYEKYLHQTEGTGDFRIDGGGLAEWKEQGPKITNNGMIMAAEDPSEHSRASTTEPRSSVGPDGLNVSATQGKPDRGLPWPPKPSASGSFTAINAGSASSGQQRQKHPLPSPQDPKASSVKANGVPEGGSPGEMGSMGSNGHAAPGQPQPQAHAQAQPQPLPSSSSEVLGDRSYTELFPYSSVDFEDFLRSTESMRWELAPGGIESLSYGSAWLDHTREPYAGQVPLEGSLLQPVLYD